MVALPFCRVTLRGQKPAPDPAYPTHPRTIGKWVRKRRMESGLLQRQVADMLEICKDSVGRWESDRFRPSRAHLQALFRLFGEPPPEIGSLEKEEPTRSGHPSRRL
jgi:transcriptional regulator with XRE-family HTH domain